MVNRSLFDAGVLEVGTCSCSDPVFQSYVFVQLEKSAPYNRIAFAVYSLNLKSLICRIQKSYLLAVTDVIILGALLFKLSR
jgi:hypothetical protein